MPADILAPHDPIRIDTLQDALEIVESGIQRFEIFGRQGVLLCPMGPSVMRCEERREFLVESPIRYGKTIRSGGIGCQS